VLVYVMYVVAKTSPLWRPAMVPFPSFVNALNMTSNFVMDTYLLKFLEGMSCMSQSKLRQQRRKSRYSNIEGVL